MLLKPLSTNVFFAVLLVTTAVMVSLALAEPVFGPVFEAEGPREFLRRVVVPLLT